MVVFGVLKAGLSIICQSELMYSNSSKQSSDQLSHSNSPVVYEFQGQSSIKLLFMYSVHCLLFDLGISHSSHLQYRLYFAEFITIVRRQLFSKISLPMTLSFLAVVRCLCRYPEELEEPNLQYDPASKCVCKSQWYFRFSCLFLGFFSLCFVDQICPSLQVWKRIFYLLVSETHLLGRGIWR